MTTQLLIFDDGQGRFGPMTDLRAVFDLRTGALTTRQRIEQALDQTADALWVGNHLVDAMHRRQPDVAVNAIEDGDWLAVNGRWLGTLDAGVKAIQQLQPGDALVAANEHIPHDQSEDELIAMRGNAAETKQWLQNGCKASQWLGIRRTEFEANQIPIRRTADAPSARTMIAWPWHILDALESTLLSDLERLDWQTWNDHEDHAAIAQHNHITVYGDHPLLVQTDATLHPNVVINTQAGPVAIDRGAEIHPFAVLQGPCFVGKNSVVQPHTNLRPNTVIGPACKVGGEISFSIMHGYSNKAHAGYLGHSLVGRWVNLGGDTNVSNLKNTYGDVRVQLEKNAPLEKPVTENTHRTFVGPIIGDFVRTAIGTRIPTGACIGTGAMLAVAGFAPKFVDRFAFLTDKNVESGGDATDMEKFLAMARTIVERRCCGLTPEEEDLLCRTAGVKAKQRRESA